MDRVRKRDMKLSDYNISREKYNELKYFCMQYNEKKKQLRESYGIGAIVSDGMPHGNTVGNPVEKKAIRNVMLKNDIELIEQTAIEADPDIYPYLIENVAEGISYEYMGRVPKARKQFYESRRYFFYLLAQKR